MNKLSLTNILTSVTTCMVAGLCSAENHNLEIEALATTVCAACHGKDGNSPIAINPIIAQQHEGNILKQLKNFKSGDRQNALMLGIASSLTDDDMAKLALYFSKFKAKTIGAKNSTLAKLGEKIYRAGIEEKNVPACGSCHLPNGAGIPGQIPRLAGQYSQYTTSQLENFKTGLRKNDVNSVMRTIASRLTKEEITSVAEFISGLQ